MKTSEQLPGVTPMDSSSNSIPNSDKGSTKTPEVKHGGQLPPPGPAVNHSRESSHDDVIVEVDEEQSVSTEQVEESDANELSYSESESRPPKQTTSKLSDEDMSVLFGAEKVKQPFSYKSRYNSADRRNRSRPRMMQIGEPDMFMKQTYEIQQDLENLRQSMKVQ